MPQPWLRLIKVSMDLQAQSHCCIVLQECRTPLQDRRRRLALSALKLELE